MRCTVSIGLLVRSACLIIGGPACASDAPALVVETKISLGDIAGRIDHLAYDGARHRLYVAELGNNSVGIVDLKTHTLIRTVSGFDEPQGLGYEPSTDTVFVANGGDGSLRLFGGADFTPVGKLALGPDADNVRVDLAARRVYIGYGSGAIAIVDALSRKRIGDIPLAAHPESFQLQADGARIFVNVPDAGAIQVVSRDAEKSVSTWKTANLRANYPLAIDSPRHRLLSVFRHPARLESFELTSGSRLGGVDTCGDADDIFVDPIRDRIYIICGQGIVDTYASTGNTFTRMAQVEIAPGSRTGLYLPDIDRLVVAIRASNKVPAAVWVLRPTSSSLLDAARPVTEILMVCEHGNVKSLMAASYFNELAGMRHLRFHAVARGTAPNSTTVPAAILEGLRTDGFDVSDFHPAAISAADVAAADRIVLINTELASTIADLSKPLEKWNDVPPASIDYGGARDALKKHVHALLDLLSASSN
jgi:YVTN family beta-propeller protein